MTDVTEANPKIEERVIIRDLETLKVLADPLRLRIIETIGQRPHTVKQVAKALGMPPNKLYYHVNLLEEHGLIRVVDTRIVSGIIEKIYLSAAKSYTPARDLFSPGASGEENSLSIMLDGLFEQTRQGMLASLEAGLLEVGDPDAGDDGDDEQCRLNLMLSRLRLDDDSALEFNQRLNALIKEYHDKGDNPQTPDNAAPTRPYRLLLAFFPQVDIDDTDDLTDEVPPQDDGPQLLPVPRV
jgi:DNA-binding transcriptional ArsR family regulator